ncbi:hybrid sensor histidine kinase/response regulator [Anaerolineales bacterium]
MMPEIIKSSSITILVIEDEDEVRENLIEFLTLDDYQVYGANGGLNGLEMAKTIKPDLIICDILMPDLNGIKVLENIRSDYELSDIPVIFLTALTEYRYQRTIMTGGGDDYITKPFTREEIRVAVQMRLDRYQQTRERERERRSDQLRDFARRITHELRTPLTTINLATQLLIYEQSSAPNQEHLEGLLETMNSGMDRMERLIEQVNTMMSLLTGELTSDFIDQYGAPEPIGQILSSAIEKAQEWLSDSRNIQIKLIPLQADVLVFCDADLIRLAFAELISNAIKFSEPHSTVRIRQFLSINEETGHESVLTEIIDSGRGMTEEDIQEAVKEFTQINREIHEQQGLGLGLTIVDRLIKIHGADLYIGSEPKLGTQVVIGLKVYQPD